MLLANAIPEGEEPHNVSRPNFLFGWNSHQCVKRSCLPIKMFAVKYHFGSKLLISSSQKLTDCHINSEAINIVYFMRHV